MIEWTKLISHRTPCGIYRRDRYYLMTFVGQGRENVNRERLWWSEGYREQRECVSVCVCGGGGDCKSEVSTPPSHNSRRSENHLFVEGERRGKLKNRSQFPCSNLDRWTRRKGSGQSGGGRARGSHPWVVAVKGVDRRHQRLAFSNRCGRNGVNLGGKLLSCSGDVRITKLFLPTDQPFLISVIPSVISFRTQALREGLTDFANLAIVTN